MGQDDLGAVQCVISYSTSLYLVMQNLIVKQESILVGCIYCPLANRVLGIPSPVSWPPLDISIPWTYLHPKGTWYRRYQPPGKDIGPEIPPPPPPPPPCKQRDTCENITFPQLRFGKYCSILGEIWSQPFLDLYRLNLLNLSFYISRNEVFIWTQREKSHFLPSYFEVIPLKYVSDPVKRCALCELIPREEIIRTFLANGVLGLCFIRTWTGLVSGSRLLSFDCWVVLWAVQGLTR